MKEPAATPAGVVELEDHLTRSIKLRSLSTKKSRLVIGTLILGATSVENEPKATLVTCFLTDVGMQKDLNFRFLMSLELFLGPPRSRSLLGSCWDINTRSAALMGRRQQNDRS